MASFTTLGDSTSLNVPRRGENISIAISGTYAQTIKLQRENGSPGSGSWETLKTYSTANATVADFYTSERADENIRLYASAVTSGTAVATLTDNDDRTVQSFKEPGQSTELFGITQDGVNVRGSLRRSNSISAVTASTALTRRLHAGKTVVVNAAAGATITLPAATATGDQYTVFCGTTISTGSLIVTVASSADTMGGGVGISTDIAGVTMQAAATDDTITMNGSTAGGIVGSWVRLTDVASGKWMVEGFLVSSGSEGNPFSNAVS